MSLFKTTGRRCDVCGKISMNKGGEYVRQDKTAGYITTNEDEGHTCTDCATEVLCGHCTTAANRATFHQPPVCEDVPPRPYDLQLIAALQKKIIRMARQEKEEPNEKLYNIACEALNVAGGLTNYVEPRPELTNAERAIERLSAQLRDFRL